MSFSPSTPPPPIPVPSSTPPIAPSSPSTPTPPEELSPPKKSPLIIIVLIVLLVIVAVFITLQFSRSRPAPSPTPTPTPQPIIIDRESLFTAPTLVVQYNGRIAGLNDPLALAYITNSFKNSTFLPRNQGRNPTNSDIVLDLKTAKAIFSSQIRNVDNHLQGEITESLVIYENNLAEDIIITREFSEYLITLIERTFGTSIVSTYDPNKTVSDSRNTISNNNSFQNYLPLMKLQDLSLNPNYQTSLLTHTNEKIIFEFTPISPEATGSISLEYALYETNSTFSYQDYLLAQTDAAPNSIIVNDVTGLINYYTNQNPSLHSIIITTVFPFPNYYLALSYNFKENFPNPENLINHLNSPDTLTLLSPHQAQLNDYEELMLSLKFLDQQ
jgi:hypothetical protein